MNSRDRDGNRDSFDVDFNSDGRPDLATANFDSNSVTIVLNQSQ